MTNGGTKVPASMASKTGDDNDIWDPTSPSLAGHSFSVHVEGADTWEVRAGVSCAKGKWWGHITYLWNMDKDASGKCDHYTTCLCRIENYNIIFSYCVLLWFFLAMCTDNIDNKVLSRESIKFPRFQGCLLLVAGKISSSTFPTK